MLHIQCTLTLPHGVMLRGFATQFGAHTHTYTQHLHTHTHTHAQHLHTHTHTHNTCTHTHTHTHNTYTHTHTRTTLAHTHTQINLVHPCYPLSAIEQVVTLRDIGCIKYKRPGTTDTQILRIERTISAQWERLAQQLGIDHDECASIAMAKLQDPGRCLSEAISRWLNRNGRKNTTWNHFLMSLRDSGLEAQAEELENALQNRAA